MTHWLTALRARLGLAKARVLSWPPVGAVRFGSFARTTPIGTRFGLERTGPIDRVYIERWLAQHRGDVRGRVLEFGDDRYTRAFGSAVQRGDVLHPEPGAAGATLCGDLRTGEGIPKAAYDCIVCTQVLQFVPDPSTALAVLAQALVPGGVLLGSVPVVSPQSPNDAAEFGEYWRFTSAGMRALLTRAFPNGTIAVQGFGNVLASVAFLHGLGAGELTDAQLAVHDAAQELIVGFRAATPCAP